MRTSELVAKNATLAEGHALLTNNIYYSIILLICKTLSLKS